MMPQHAQNPTEDTRVYKTSRPSHALRARGIAATDISPLKPLRLLLLLLRLLLLLLLPDCPGGAACTLKPKLQRSQRAPFGSH